MTGAPPQGVMEAIAWLGLLMTGVWTAYKTHRNDVSLATVKKTAREARDEIKNNHGSSKGDAIDRIESKVDEIANRLVHVERDTERHTLILKRHADAMEHTDDALKSLGHQVGESRASALAEHTSLDHQIADHTQRLRVMEQKCRC